METHIKYCESKITKVVVYVTGAVIFRELVLPELPEERVELVVMGVTPLAEDGSVRASVVGDREVIGVHTRLVLPEPGAVPNELLLRIADYQRELYGLSLKEEHLEELISDLNNISFDLRLSGRRRKIMPHNRIGDALAISNLIDDKVSQTEDRLVAVKQKQTQIQIKLEAAKVEELQTGSVSAATPTKEFRVFLGPSSQQCEELVVSYIVEAARWWPAYTARLFEQGSKADFSMEPFVAQATMEDWAGVEISLCTADLTRELRLPELSSLRIGKSRPSKKRGYRPPPEGLNSLFAPYDEIMGNVDRTDYGIVSTSATAPLCEPEPCSEEFYAKTDKPMKQFRDNKKKGKKIKPKVSYAASEASFGGGKGEIEELIDDVACYSADSWDEAPEPEMRTRAGFVPMASAQRKSSGLNFVSGFLPSSKPSTGRREPAPPPVEAEPADGWLDFDALVLAEIESSSRGKLIRIPRATTGVVAEALSKLEQISPPAQTSDPQSSRGKFSFLFDAGGNVDILDNGATHRILLSCETCEVTTNFRTAPVFSEDVFREVLIRNPFDAPLLAGPVDVFINGELTITSEIETVDRGGELVFGLGVEEHLRVARNVRVKEETRGLISSKAGVVHQISLELSSALGYDATLHLVERIPVTDDKEVEVRLLKTTPKPSEYEQLDRGNPVRGGLLWEMVIPPGEKRTVNYDYEILLSAKREIIGGNRRG